MATKQQVLYKNKHSICVTITMKNGIFDTDIHSPQFHYLCIHCITSLDLFTKNSNVRSNLSGFKCYKTK